MEGDALDGPGRDLALRRFWRAVGSGPHGFRWAGAAGNSLTCLRRVLGPRSMARHYQLLAVPDAVSWPGRLSKRWRLLVLEAALTPGTRRPALAVDSRRSDNGCCVA